MSNNKRPLSEVIHTLKEEQNGKKTSVGQIIDRFERRGFGPLLLVPSLFLVLPTGAIPGAPIVCGVIIIFVTAQIIIGQKRPWIPYKIRKIKFDGSQLKKGLKKIEKPAAKVDKKMHSRMSWFITPFSKRIVAFVCMVLAVVIMLVGAIPFAMTLPALSIVFFSLGFIANDGFMVAIGITVASIASTGGMVWLLHM